MEFGKIENVVIKNYCEIINILGSVSGTVDIDLENGNIVTATITGITTFTFINPPPTGKAGSFTLILTNGASSTITWPTSVKWPSATPPTLTASGIDVLTFFTIDNGTTWIGTLTIKDAR